MVLFNLIMFVLAEVPLAGYFVAPEATAQKVEALNEWMGSHARQIVIVLATVMGVYLVARGIAGVA